MKDIQSLDVRGLRTDDDLLLVSALLYDGDHTLYKAMFSTKGVFQQVFIDMVLSGHNYIFSCNTVQVCVVNDTIIAAIVVLHGQYKPCYSLLHRHIVGTNMDAMDFVYMYRHHMITFENGSQSVPYILTLGCDLMSLQYGFVMLLLMTVCSQYESMCVDISPTHKSLLRVYQRCGFSISQEFNRIFSRNDKGVLCHHMSRV